MKSAGDKDRLKLGGLISNLFYFLRGIYALHCLPLQLDLDLPEQIKHVIRFSISQVPLLNKLIKECLIFLLYK